MMITLGDRRTDFTGSLTPPTLEAAYLAQNMCSINNDGRSVCGS